MKEKDENIHKELDLIQGVVKRMAQNSFQVKAWTVGILSALVVFQKDSLIAGAGGNETAVVLSGFLFVPVFCFWYLDAFFLRTERLYRKVYAWVVEHRATTSEYLYDLNTFKRKDAKGQECNLIDEIESEWEIMFSKTLVFFYLAPLIFAVLVLTININR